MTVDIGNTTMCTSPFIPNSTLLFGLYYIKSTRAIGIYNSADLARLVDHPSVKIDDRATHPSGSPIEGLLLFPATPVILD